MLIKLKQSEVYYYIEANFQNELLSSTETITDELFHNFLGSIADNRIFQPILALKRHLSDDAELWWQLLSLQMYLEET